MEVSRLRFVAFALVAWILALVFPVTLQAGEIVLDKSEAVGKERGSVVFSFTVRGAVLPRSTVKWRSLERIGEEGDVSVDVGSPLFGKPDTFSKTERKLVGRFVRLELVPGEYEFYAFSSLIYGQGRGAMNSGSREFSRRFTVKAGKTNYVGNLDILAMQPIYGAGALLSGAFGGPLLGSVDLYPSLRDAGKIDLPMLSEQGGGVDETLVTLHPHDVKEELAVVALKERVAKGDLAAGRLLVEGLSNGWFVADSGEEFKMDPDLELKMKLATELETAGVAGGAFALAEANYTEEKINAADGLATRSRYLADAARYYWPAISRVSEVYDRSLPGAERDSELAKLWKARAGFVKLPERQGIPYLDEAGRQEYGAYLNASDPRYFALSRHGSYGMSTGDNASGEEAIKACEARNLGSADRCRLYASKRSLIWDACPIELAGPEATNLPSPTLKGKLDPLIQPPNRDRAVRAMFKEFLASPLPRAFAYSENGEVAMASGDCRAAFRALQRCRERAGQVCRLYVLDDQLVQGSTDSQLVREEQRLVELVERVSQDSAKLTQQSVAVK